MGMYTELNMNVELKKDIPKQVIEVLNFMVTDKNKPSKLPIHEFFNTHRWEVLFLMDSYYFDAKTNCSLRLDDIGKCYYLNIQTNLKNYDSEIQKFIDWIKPYVFTEGFWGHTRYEECREPSLIYDGVEE